jgi:hypothetical protein
VYGCRIRPAACASAARGRADGGVLTGNADTGLLAREDFRRG